MMSRQTLRKTLKWLAAILLVAGVAGGGYGYWLWVHCDEYLVKLLLQKQLELAPDWDMEIGRAHFDWYRRVHVYDVKLKAKGQDHTVATLPEVVIAIDRELFRSEQKIEIESVRIINPVVDFRRDLEGVWNWQALLTLEPSERSLPEWFIEQGTLKIRYAQAHNLPPTEITLTDTDLKLIPSGKRLFTFLGKGNFNDAGKLALKGDWNVDAKQWSVNGQLTDIQRSGELLQLAAGTSPAIRQKLVELGSQLEHTRLAMAPAEDTRVAALPGAPVPLPRPQETTSALSLPDFGLETMLDLKFHIAQTEPQSEWEFRTIIQLKQGTLSHPILPFPLRGLAGEVYWDNRQIEFRNLAAQNGTTRISLSGKLNRTEPQASGHLTVELTNLLLDDRFRSRLPLALRGALRRSLPLRFGGCGDIVAPRCFFHLAAQRLRADCERHRHAKPKFPLPHHRHYGHDQAARRGFGRGHDRPSRGP